MILGANTLRVCNGRDTFVDVPLLYRRGVWAVTNALRIDRSGNLAIDEVASIIVHVPTGIALCEKPSHGKMTTAFFVGPRALEVAINIVRMLTPWSDLGSNMAPGDFLAFAETIPGALLDAVNEHLEIARAKVQIVEPR